MGIVVVAMLVFLFQRYGARKRALVAVVLLAGLTVLIVEPLNEALRELYIRNRVVALAVKIAATRGDSLIRKGKIESIYVTYRNDLVHVSIDGYTQKDAMSDAQERADQFQKMLSADIGEPVTLELDIVPVEIVKIRSALARFDKGG